MKNTIVKLISALVAVVALVLLVGDLPDVNMVHFAFVKIAGIALLFIAGKVWERFIPNDEEV